MIAQEYLNLHKWLSLDLLSDSILAHSWIMQEFWNTSFVANCWVNFSPTSTLLWSQSITSTWPLTARVALIALPTIQNDG